MLKLFKNTWIWLVYSNIWELLWRHAVNILYISVFSGIFLESFLCQRSQTVPFDYRYSRYGTDTLDICFISWRYTKTFNCILCDYLMVKLGNYFYTQKKFAGDNRKQKTTKTDSKKLVTVWAKYLSTSERFYLALSENAMDYWLLSYH